MGKQSVFDELDALAAPLTGPACSIGAALDSMDPAERAQFVAAMADPSRLGSHIAAVMKKRGHDVSGQTVQRHRRGECRCER